MNDALTAAIKSNPSPVYHKDVIKKITTGNFDDNMKDIAGCDWVIEVVVERLDIKQKVFEQVEKYQKTRNIDYFQHFRYSHPHDGRRQKR